MPAQISTGATVAMMLETSSIAPYPTRSEAGKRAAGSYFTEKLFGAGTKRIVRFLLRFA